MKLILFILLLFILIKTKYNGIKDICKNEKFATKHTWCKLENPHTSKPTIFKEPAINNKLKTDYRPFCLKFGNKTKCDCILFFNFKN